MLRNNQSRYYYLKSQKRLKRIQNCRNHRKSLLIGSFQSAILYLFETRWTLIMNIYRSSNPQPEQLLGNILSNYFRLRISQIMMTEKF